MSERIITKPDEMEWVTIPAGEFIMGSEASQNHRIKELDSEFPDEWLAREQPQRKVYLSEYTIAKYTVTNRQFKAFVDETGYRTERELDGLGKSIWYKLREAPLEEKLDHPVVCVTRKDALAYCEWFSRETGVEVGLPTEAQWEKAARGCDGRFWPWGNEFDEDKCNIAGKGTTSVGNYPRGVHRLTGLWIALPMFGSGATTGLRQTTTTMLRLVIPKVLIAVNITWCVAARGIEGNGVRVASEPPPVFGTTLRVIHSAFVWFGDPLGKSSIYNPRTPSCI